MTRLREYLKVKKTTGVSKVRSNAKEFQNQKNEGSGEKKIKYVEFQVSPYQYGKNDVQLKIASKMNFVPEDQV